MRQASSSRLLIALSLATGLLLVLSLRYVSTPAQPVATLPTQSVLPTDAPLSASSDTIALNNPAEISAVEPVRVPVDNRPVPNRVILQFAPNATESERAAYLAQAGLTPVAEIVSLNSVIVQLQPGITLEESPLVSTQPDYYVQAQEAPTRNDPLYSGQWGLTAVGIPALWDALPANTSSVTVAVIDSGICANHPDLAGHIGAGWNFVNDNALVEDLFGHGCAVSGIIAAQMDNALGIAGIVPNIQLMPLRVLDANGVGRYSDVAAAIVYAVDHNAQYINVSLGGTQPSALLESAVTYAESHQVKIIAAAGNGSSTSLLYPAAYPSVIAVGAVDTTLQRSSFSNYGAGIDVFAPGRDILSTKSDGTYGRFSGTSFAAPFVTGALILAQSSGQTIALDGGVLHAGTSETPVINIPPVSSPAVIDADVITALQQNGQAHVMIALALPPSAQGDDDTPAIAQAQNDVLAQLANTDFVLAQQFVHVPALAGTMTASALNVLQNNAAIARIYIDQPTEAASFRSVIAINGDDVQAGAVSGFHLTGAGVTVAVLDSGIDMTNPAVSDDVIKQKCFSSTSSCPGNLPVADVAPDSSLHGTNISAIITAPEGVAPDANIVAVRVLDDYGRGQSSDWVAALDWITSQVSNGTLDIDIINMSLGSTRLYKPAVGSSLASCDQVFPAEAIAIQNVLTLGIPVFAATGNQGSSDSINSPACVSGVIGVGAIYDSNLGNEPDTGTYRDQLHGSWPGCQDTATQANQITCFTNSNGWMDIVAPGAQIIIGGTGGSGTSQASPHAAGVAALMLQGRTLDTTPASISPASIEAILRSTGPLITDPRNGRVFHQLDALQAVTQFINPVQFASCATVTGASVAECNALVAFYNSTLGPTWSNRTNWLQTNAICTWYGVTCTGNQVTGLNLAGNNLKGTIPTEIAGLSHLQILNLSRTYITGGLANLAGLSALEELRLDGMSQLDGAAFPPEWGLLIKLKKLSLTGSDMSGALPTQIANMASLEELYLNNVAGEGIPNTFSGSLPPVFASPTKLKILKLSGNQFSGAIPNWSALTLLETLEIANNQLTGSIPATLSALSNLKTLDLSGNQLGGTLPASWTTTLQMLKLNNNALSGVIPSLSTLNNLVDVDLSNNQFTGSVPAFSSTSTTLNSLNFSHNALTTLPATMNSSALHILDVSYNQVNAVPAGITGLTGLNRFAADHNRIPSLPDNIASLPALQTLFMQYNLLTDIPTSITHISGFNFCYNRIDVSTLAPAIANWVNIYNGSCPGGATWYQRQVIPPSDLSAEIKSPNSMLLSWTRPDLALYQYEFFIAPAAGGTLQKHAYRFYDNAGTTVTYLLTGLQENTAYKVAIRVLGGDSIYNIESVMSDPIFPPPTLSTGCSSVQGITAGECRGLESLYNSLGGTGWNSIGRWLNADEPRLLAYGMNNSAYLVDTKTGGVAVEYVYGPSPGNFTIQYAGFNPSGTEVIVAGWGNGPGIKIYNTATGAKLTELTIPDFVTPANATPVHQVVYNPAGTRFLTLTTDNRLRLWNRATMTVLWNIPVNYVGGFSNSVRYNSAGTQILLSNASVGSVLLDASDGAAIRTFHAAATSAMTGAFSPDGTRVITADSDGNVRIWDTTDSSAPLTSFFVGTTLSSVEYSPDGSRYLVLYNQSGVGQAARMYRTSDNVQLWQRSDVNATPGGAIFTTDSSKVILKDTAVSDIVTVDAAAGTVIGSYDARVIQGATNNNSVFITQMAYAPTAVLPTAMYPCTWYAVVCSGGHVTALNMNAINLVGRIPAQITLLTSLNTLDMSQNGQLKDGLPVEVTQMTWLKVLNLTSSFSAKWTLPPEIGNMTGLQQLLLKTTNVSGTLPTEIGNLSNLETLDISVNGTVPDMVLPASIGNLTKLKKLDARVTFINGPIPASIGNLSNLEYLDFASTNLSGALPATMGNLTKLKHLDLVMNYLTGSIPASFGNLVNLEKFYLGNSSKMTGPLPPELGNLTNLKDLQIFAVNLTGSIPASFGNLTNLEILDLSKNQLTGSIPASLGNLHALKELRLAYNRLTGPIPTELNYANLPNLTVMQLQYNQLEGDIPATVAGFPLTPVVTYISVDSNRLTATLTAVRNYLNSYDSGWKISQAYAPTNFTVTDVSSGTATVKWQPTCDDPLSPGNQCSLPNGYFEVFCSATPGGPYTSMGHTVNETVHQLTITGLTAESTTYCIVRTRTQDSNTVAPTNPMTWYSGDSNELQVLTTAVFGVEVPVENIPSIFDVEVPEAENPEDLGDGCSEEAGRAVSFRGSGRAVSFRGSGRAVSFRGSGDAQLVVASTEGSQFDTVLTVWRVPAAPVGQLPTPFTEANAQFMGCNDDSPFTGTEPGDPNGGVERPPDSPAYSSYLAVPFDRDFDFYFVVYAKNEEAGGLLFSIGGEGSTITGLPAQQVAALSALYSSTGGAGWTNHTGWFDTDTPCSWYGITCFSGNIIALNLANNHLVGTFPAAFGDITTLTSLQLQNNALRGAIPDTISGLTALTTLDVGYNGLSASGAALTYLNSNDADWASTQTVPPTDITPGIISNDGATVTFTPIAYTAHGGFYEAGCGLTANGPYVVNNRTANKSATGITLQNLLPGTPYFCTLRTFTPTHTGQSSEILSTVSSEFTFTTSVPGWLVGANGSYTIAPTPPFPLIFSMNTSNLPSAYPGDLPDSVCGTQVGRAVSFRGSGGGIITVNSSGTDYPEAVSIWSVPIGQPATNATQIDCADSRQDDHFAYANIPVDREFIVIVTGNFHTSGTLKLTMKNVGEPPVAVNNSYTGVEDTPLTVVAPGVLKNDVNLANAPLTLTVTTPPAHGTVVLAQNGGFVYTPAPNYNGADAFVYQISDGIFPASTATVSLTLSAVQDAPDAVADIVKVNQNTATVLTVLANDIEPDGEALTLSTVTQGTRGTVVKNGNGTATYTPTTGYIGPDAFTYTACDTYNACDTATVSITVRPVTGATTILSISVTDAANQDDDRVDTNRTTLWLGNGSSQSRSFLGLRFSDVLIPPGTIITNARIDLYSQTMQTSSIRLLIAAEASDNSTPLSLTLPPALRPATASRVSTLLNSPWSAGAWYTPATITPVIQELVNRPGWQRGNSLTLLLRGVGNPLARRTVAAGSNFAPRLVVTFIYPNANEKPLAVDDTTRTNQNTAVLIPVLSNDSDPNDDVLHIGTIQTPAHGSAIDSGGGNITYTPTTGFIGTDTFTYQSCDAGGLCATVTVTINITPTPGVPTTLTFVITNGGDDVNQDSSGLATSQGVLGMGQNNGAPLYAGLRFGDIFIPPGSTITSARLEMYVPADQTGDIQLLIAAEASNDSPAFSLTSLPAQRRVTAPRSSTGFSAPWTGGTWQIVSADLAAAVQSVTNRTGWRYRQHLTLILRGTGDTRRMVSGYESNPAFAPRLVVDFIPASMTSLSVEAEPDSLDDGTLIDPLLDAPTEIPVTPDATEIVVTDTPLATQEIIDVTADATEAVIDIPTEIPATPTDVPTEIPAATEEVPATVEYNPPEATATEPAASATEDATPETGETP